MKNLFRILLPLFLIAAATSCASKSDIDDLQEQIDNLKTGKIATIEQQLTGIQASITSLQATDTQLSSFVSTLQLETSGIKADLSSKEKALGDRIDALKKYVDDELGKNRDWASATFATLEQYQSLLSELAGIRQSISSLETDLRAEIESSIAASESSMKGWVSEQLSGYYTITQMDAKLKALADSDAAAQQSISELAEALAKAKTDLTAAYTQAIAEAIANHEGTITTKIAADIKTATDALQAQIDALDLRIAALEGMIQSVTIVPDCSDGSVLVSSTGILTIDCIISPVSSVKGLTKDNVKVFITSAITKSASVTVIEASDVQVDETDGTIEIKADISSVFPAGEGETLMAAVKVSAGKSDFTSAFIPVTVTLLVDLGLSVKWSSCNIGASSPEEYGGYYQWAGLQDVTDTGIYLDFSNCPYHTGSSDSSGWTKYVPSGKSSYWSGSGSPDNKTDLDPEDDVAHVKLGGKWRMPTIEEWRELMNTDNCSWTWTTINGIKGRKVQSKKTGYTDNWIFLPAAGYRYRGGLYDVGSIGNYWSSSLGTDIPSYAYLLFVSGGVGTYDFFRCYGQSVRPVWADPYVSLDKTGLVLHEGESILLTATVYPETATNKSVSWESSDTSVATVDSNGKVTAKGNGSATITVRTEDGNKTATCAVKVVKPAPAGAVDLGLSVNWATCNLGASAPEEYGDYYAWGATEPWYNGDSQSPSSWKKSDGYILANCPYHTGSDRYTGWTKYIPSDKSSYWSGTGSPDNKTVLDPEDEVAHVELGGKWRMPTTEEFNELANPDNCSWTCTTLNGIKGYMVQSKKSGYTDMWIFLPAAGYRGVTNLYDVGIDGDYWSSSLRTDLPNYAWDLCFSSGSVYTGSNCRFLGLSVRPVTE